MSSTGIGKVFFTDSITAEEVQTAVTTIASKMNAHFEKHLAHGKKFMVSDNLTIADFRLAAWYYSVTLNETKKHPSLTDALKADLANFPLLSAYLARLGEEMKEHLASRPMAPY